MAWSRKMKKFLWVAALFVFLWLGTTGWSQIPERRPEIEVYRVELEDGRHMYCAAITWFSQVGIDCNWNFEETGDE